MGYREKYKKYRKIISIIQRKNRPKAKEYLSLEYPLLKLDIIILKIEYFNEYFNIILIIFIYIIL